MPAKHDYKCLNPNCPSIRKYSTDTSKVRYFSAMNSPQPTCPHCGSIKLEDLGEYRAPQIMIGGKGDAKYIDSELKSIATQYGMTNMSNKGGKPVKGGAMPARGDFGYVKVHGVEVPVDHNPTVSRLPVTSHLKVKPLKKNMAGVAANVMQQARE